MTNSYDPSQDGAKMSFEKDLSYGEYLSLDEILFAQRPLTDAHDETLFIIQHQTSELWMKLAIHELAAARALIAGGEFEPSFKMLARVSRIFEQLNQSWDVLRTLTPSDYTTFREAFGNSSGFQSYQYRLIEYLLGNRNTNLMKVHEHKAEIHARLERELEAPSLYEVVVEKLFAHLGRKLPEGAFSRGAPHHPSEAIQSAWIEVYRVPSAHWTYYELAEKLVDLEDYFRRWRFNHVTTVERVIGFKRGSGGTSGVQYLRRMLDVQLFPELWALRTEL